MRALAFLFSNAPILVAAPTAVTTTVGTRRRFTVELYHVGVGTNTAFMAVLLLPHATAV